MKLLIKRLGKVRLIQKLLALLIAFYLRFVYATTKWEYILPQGFDLHEWKDKAAIWILWHNRLAILPFIMMGMDKKEAVSSTHADGMINSYLQKNMGFGIIGGSSNENAFSAAKGVIRSLKQGNKVCITPDGPKGPRHKINGNITDLALIAKAPIVPVSVAVSKFKQFNSWDKFILPLPFGKAVVTIGKVIYVESKDETSSKKQLCEEELNAISERAIEKI